MSSVNEIETGESVSPISRLFSTLCAHPWMSVLFVLVLIKLELLLRGHNTLVQDHWRVAPDGANPAFAIFFCLMLLASLLIPVWRGSPISIGNSKKGVLITFLIVAALLMPQYLQKNYPCILANGVLSLSDLRYNLFRDFFDGSPYLSIHLLALGVGWWIAWKRRDDRIFLTFFSVSLVVVFWAQFMRYGISASVYDILLILGLAFLGGWWGRRFRVRGGVLRVLVVLSVLCFLGGFVLIVPKLGVEVLYFSVGYILFSAIFAILLAGSIFSNWKAGFLLSVFLGYACFLAINSGYPLCTNIGNTVRLSLLGGRYFADDILLIIGAYLCLRRFRRLGLIVFGLVSLLYLAMAYVDLNYYKESGHRLSGFMLEMGGGTGLAVKMVGDYLNVRFFLLFGTIALVGLSGTILALRVGGGEMPARKIHHGWIVVTLFLVVSGTLLCKADSFLGSVPRNLLSSSGLFTQLRYPRAELNDLKIGFEKLGVPFNTPREPFVGGKTYRNLILVVMESSYNKYLSLFGGKDETQPLMRRYVDRMERYPNMFCNWPSSNHARLAIWTGLYPIRPYLSELNPMIGRSSLSELLAGHGYHNAIFYSSDRNYTRMNDYLGHREIHRFEDAATMGKGLGDEQKVSWGVREDVTLGYMTEYLAERSRNGKPFFMTYIPACPHMPYDTHDKRFEKFQEGLGRLDGNYTGAYKNQLLYMDWIFDSLMQSIEANGLSGDTVVVFVNDHGEMVNSDDGGLGHGWSLVPGIANIPLLVVHPESVERQVNPAIGSQVDLLPTILDYLGVVAPADMPLQGMSLRRKVPEGRRIYLGSYKDAAVIDGNKYIHAPNGEMTDAVCYRVSNDGAKTLFEEDDSIDFQAMNLLLEEQKKFFKNQQSLIRHYDSYKWSD